MVDKPGGVGVSGHIVVKIKITDNKGAAFQGGVVLKEIRKLFHKEQVLELFFSGSEEESRDRRCAVSIEVRRKSAETVQMKNVES